MSHDKVSLPEASTTAEQSVTLTPVPGGWTERTLTLEGRSFRLVLPAQPDEFLEVLSQMPRERHDDTDVYWAQLWQAAPPTATRILQAQWPAGAEALEFGCGLGIAGLAGLAAGLQVTFSDYVEFAVQTALENARLNGFTAEGAILDWRSPPSRRWPVLLACDILYNQQMHEPLIQFIDTVLTDDGICWIGDAGRFHAAKFLHLARSRGFQVQLEDEQGQPLAATHHGKFQLFILRRQ
jgi:predicted nicotinamide N-methyase